MNRYEYIEEIKSDILDFLDGCDLGEYANKEEAQESLYDLLFIEDCVTGNASGSYYCNSYRAYEAIGYEGFELLAEALEEFGESNIKALEKGFEWCDVTIRCYLLGEALEEALESEEFEEMWNNSHEEEARSESNAKKIRKLF